MAILKTTLNTNGNLINSPLKEITVSVDEAVTTANVNDYLPNNNSKYSEEFMFIPTGSSGTIYASDAMLVCSFNAEIGTVDDTKTTWLCGQWKCLARVAYK
jgi:hypothetical protein